MEMPMNTVQVEELAAVVLEPGTYLERLDRFVRLSLRHQAECQPLFEALLALPGQLPVPGTEVGDRMQGMHRRYLGTLESMVEAGESEGALRKGTRTSHAFALAALIHGYAKVACMGGTPLVEDPAAEILASFLDGARAR
jgi:hypothetical protein